jgi:oligoribonuclease NrnB/cAMP/cGMP phosphodiesterase (DHH superfamily)
MKIYNVSHNDLDGIGCTVLTRLICEKIGAEAKIYNTGYNYMTDTLSKALDEFSQETDEAAYFIISDISMKAGVGLDERFDRYTQEYSNTTFLLLDHHATAYWLRKYNWATVEVTDSEGVEHCGTYLISKFYKEVLGEENFNEAMNQMVEWIDLYDTWRWVNDYPGNHFVPANDLNRLNIFRGHKKMAEHLYELCKANESIEIPDTLTDGHLISCYMMNAEDLSILNVQNQIIDKLVQDKSEQMITGTLKWGIKTLDIEKVVRNHFINRYGEDTPEFMEAMNRLHLGYVHEFKVGAVFLDSYVSEVGNKLCDLYPELDFVILITLPGNISFRSNKTLEVPLGLIAQAVGRGNGGGHDNAAGAQVSKDKVKDLGKLLIRGFRADNKD